MRLNEDGWTIVTIDVLASGMGEIIGGSQRRGAVRGTGRTHGRAATSTRSTTPWYSDVRRYGEVRGSASTSSVPSPTSPNSPTCARPIRFPRTPEKPGIEAHDLNARVFLKRERKDADAWRSD
jgi:hypothetical protein